MVAAWMSVCGLANVTLGLSHGIGHQLGARCNVPHGETSAVMMPHVMAFNREQTMTRQAWVAEAMGVDIAAMSEEEAATAAADEVAALVREDMGLPWRLRDVGVAHEDFPGIAADALEDIIVASNPRQVTSTDEVIDLLGLVAQAEPGFLANVTACVAPRRSIRQERAEKRHRPLAQGLVAQAAQAMTLARIPG